MKFELHVMGEWEVFQLKAAQPYLRDGVERIPA